MLSVLEAEGRLERSATDALVLEPWSLPRSKTEAEADEQARKRAEVLRRYLNVAVALVGIVLTLPIMLVVAVAIKLCSPGPALFTQVRVGVDRRTPGQLSGNWRRTFDHGGRLFTLYKFRTMHVEDGPVKQVWAGQDDPRIFPLGRTLRKLRLDELPQLFNVLRGDMNIVGPRPEQPAIFTELREQIERYQYRQKVLPGITGLAQVSQHYDTCIDDVRRKVSFDLEYIQRRSVTEDLRIMAQTVPTIILRKGGW